MKESIPERVGRWVSSRKKPSRDMTLSQNNTYIFPTAQGFSFLLLLVLLLIAAINYQNSLIYLLVFFLGAVFFISIWMCYINVAGLKVFAVDCEGVFQGKRSFISIGAQKQEGLILGLKIGTDIHNMHYVVLHRSEPEVLSVDLDYKKRGKYMAPRIRLESTYPFGFIRAWAWAKLDSEYYVYPEPLNGEIACAADIETANAQRSRLISGDKDILRPHEQGESTARINWKKYVGTGELLVLDASDHVSLDSNWVRWADYEGISKEAKLSYMCKRIVDMYGEGIAFGLDLPGNVREPEYSKKHYVECLRLLAGA